MDNDITLVTAFLDIGRETWNNNDFKRTPKFYIESFLTYLKYPYKMVCYIDEKYLSRVLETYESSPYKNKVFIPINKDWLSRNIYAWSLIENDRIILNSDTYKNFLKNRLPIMYPDGVPETGVREHLCPENIYPEYNVINHCKIDFIMNAIENNHINTYFTGWTDFGYFSTYHSDVDTLPRNILDTSKFDRNKITICLRRKIIENDKNMFFTLLYAYELFIGAFYAGPTHIMKRFQELYHDSVIELYKNNISDDDQHVYIQVYVRDPEIFNLCIFDGDWPKALTVFQKID
jgi:hypothetical protein